MSYKLYKICILEKSTLKRTERKEKMKIVVARRTSKTGNTYLVMEAVAPWGKIVLTFDKGNIMQCLPKDVDFRELNENGIVIGEIRE